MRTHFAAIRSIIRRVATALLPLLIPCVAALAQTGRITGTVTDSMAESPVSNVTIAVTGTRLAGLTADDGKFAIAGVPAGTYTIEARRVGYAPITRAGVVVTAGGTTTINFRTIAAVLHLQETVITGLTDPTAGTKVPFTVAKVTSEDMPVPAMNAIQSVQGKVAGLQVMTSSGQPGSGVDIQLRTPTSINKSTSPLLVVDGVILSETSADLNSLDIESVEVVKGAAAASLYGSRAAAGVIQIKTARGTGIPSGQTQFTFRSEEGMSSLSHDVQRAQYMYYMTNAQGQYVDANGNVVTRDNRVPLATAVRYQDVPYSVPTYNPVDELFHPGPNRTNSMTIAQNGDKTNFLTTISQQTQDGVLRDHGGYDRTDFRINLDHRPRDDVQISISAYHARSNLQNLDGNTFFDLTATAPDVNLLQPDPDGTKYIFQPDPQGVHPSPLYLAETEQDNTARVRTLGSMDLRYTPLTWLSADANASYDRSDENTTNFLDRGLKSENYATGDPGELSINNNSTAALNAQGGVSLIKDFGKLTARSTGRVLIERSDYQSETGTGTNFAVSGVPALNAALSRSSTSTEQNIRGESYLLTAGADYGGLFVFDGLVRREGSSLFGPDEKWHNYYRASGAYRMAEQSWWPWKRVNEFKIRLSQGTAGTRPSFADQYETYSISSAGTLSKTSLGNEFLKPETARETEVGLDAIFDNKYSLQLSRAATKTTDELIQIPLPGAVGYSSQWQNAGAVEGNSLEGTFEAELYRHGTTSWKMGIVADRSRNHISEFDRACVPAATISYRCTGEDLETMWGVAFLHNANGLPASQKNAAPGTFEVNDDGLLVAVGPNSHYTDQGKWGTSVVSNGTTYQWGMPIIQLDSTGQQAFVKIGDGNPRFHYGISNNVSWKGFQFYGLLDTQVGGNVYNQNNQRSYQYQRSADVDQAGKPDSLKKTIDYYSVIYNGNAIEDWFVEPGGYVKLREVSVQYKIPPRFMSRIPGNHGAGASISLVGRNLKTWTRYSGYDPEAGALNNRLDSYDYPQYRTFSLVLQLQF